MWCLSASYEATVHFTRTRPIQVAGTSFSAPIVTGTAALLQRYPWMSNDNLRTTLLTTAQDIGAVGVDSKFGWGLLDAGKAMNEPRPFRSATLPPIRKVHPILPTPSVTTFQARAV